jgi:hypothetical protein
LGTQQKAESDRERNARVKALVDACQGLDPRDVRKAVTAFKKKQAARGLGVIQGAEGEEGKLAEAFLLLLRPERRFKYEVKVGLSEDERLRALDDVRAIFRLAAEYDVRSRGRGSFFIAVGNDKSSPEAAPRAVEAVRAVEGYGPRGRHHERGAMIEGVTSPRHGTFASAPRPGIAFAAAPVLERLRNRAWELFRHRIQGDLTHERWGNAFVVGPRGELLHRAFLSPEGQWYDSTAAQVPEGIFYTGHYDCPTLFAEDGQLHEDDLAIMVFNLEGYASVFVETALPSVDGSTEAPALEEKPVLEPGHVYAMDGRAGHAVRSSDNRVCVIFRPLRLCGIPSSSETIADEQLAEDAEDTRAGRPAKLYWERDNRYS